jgi:hypothetical protein
VRAAWVAGSVRARLLLARTLGAEGARRLASAPSLDAALAGLAGTPYAGAAGAGSDLAAVQHEIARVTLLRLRLLAGWLHGGATEMLRPLAAWFELVNVEDRLGYLAGGRLRPAFELGGLAVAWPRASLAQTPGELRDVLAASAWDYRGDADPREIHTALRLAWAARVLAALPEARAWVGGAVALVLARRELDDGVARRVPPGERLRGLPWRVPDEATLDGLRAGLPPDASWSLGDIESERDLWHAEASWWRRVEVDAATLVRGPRAGRGVVLGAVALLALDSVRVSAAVASAARGGTGPGRKAFDALA